jgi:predicted Fe-Mo cluster-binding NifX family protein
LRFFPDEGRVQVEYWIKRQVNQLKIAVTAKGKTLTSESDPRFGRCGYFVIVDPDTMDFQGIENGSSMAQGGAGPQAVQTIARLGVDTVITGNVGPNAFEALKAAGIKVMIGASGTVNDTIESYKNGSLSEIKDASVRSHSGLGKNRR